MATAEDRYILKLLETKDLLNFPSLQWPRLVEFIKAYANKKVRDDRIMASKEYGGDL